MPAFVREMTTGQKKGTRIYRKKVIINQMCNGAYAVQKQNWTQNCVCLVCCTPCASPPAAERYTLQVRSYRRPIVLLHQRMSITVPPLPAAVATRSAGCLHSQSMSSRPGGGVKHNHRNESSLSALIHPGMRNTAISFFFQHTTLCL